MAELNLAQAIQRALSDEMRRDERVVVLGEDVGPLGGLFGATAGLLEEFGETRVIEMPLAEGSAVGTAVGMALYGLRPVVEIQLADFAFPAMDQIVQELARIRYRSGGRYSCPVVVRMASGGGVGGGPSQSQSPEAHFCHEPGLIVAAPSSPHDAAGLLRAALRGDDPVVLLEPKRLYREPRGPVPDDDFEVPLGVARVARTGSDVSAFCWGGMVAVTLEAAERAAELGVEVEVVDLRTLVPMDVGAVLGSVAKTGRAVVVAEAPRTGGFAAEIAANLAERALLHLEAPVLRVTGWDTPVPRVLEDSYMPDSRRVLSAFERAANF